MDYSEFFKTEPFDDAVEKCIAHAILKIHREMDYKNEKRFQMKMAIMYGILPIGFHTDQLFRTTV